MSESHITCTTFFNWRAGASQPNRATGPFFLCPCCMSLYHMYLFTNEVQFHFTKLLCSSFYTDNVYNNTACVCVVCVCYRHVVNYDFPNHIEDYVHRVGRTGRAGYAPQFITNDLCIVVVVCWCRRTGKALTFITRENWKWARELCNILAQAEQVRAQLCNTH